MAGQGLDFPETPRTNTELSRKAKAHEQLALSAGMCMLRFRQALPIAPVGADPSELSEDFPERTRKNWKDMISSHSRLMWKEAVMMMIERTYYAATIVTTQEDVENIKKNLQHNNLSRIYNISKEKIFRGKMICILAGSTIAALKNVVSQAMKDVVKLRLGEPVLMQTEEGNFTYVSREVVHQYEENIDILRKIAKDLEKYTVRECGCADCPTRPTRPA